MFRLFTAVPTLHRLSGLALLVALAACSAPAPQDARAASQPRLTDDTPVATLTASTGDDADEDTPGSHLVQINTQVPLSGTTTLTRLSDLPPELQQIWQRTKLPERALSLVIAEPGQTPLYAINADQPRNPASVMKLVTTYAALHGLGPSYTWNTELLASRLPQPGEDTLASPLYIRASGDPSLRLEDAWAMLRELRMRGVRVLPGIVIDRNRFGDVGIDPGAFDNAPDRVYNASPDAFVVGHNAVRVILRPHPSGKSWDAQLDPALPGIQIDNRVVAVAGRCRGAPAVNTRINRSGNGVTLQLNGQVAPDCGEFGLHRLALPPQPHGEQTLAWLWQNLGGTLTGPVRSGSVPPDAVTVSTYRSPALIDVMRPINKLSNNLMTRQVLLTLGAEQGGGPATVASSGAALRNVLARQGLNLPELVVDNGAGLSREARISANSLLALLTAAWRSPLMPEFVSSMGLAGEDGTVRRSWQGGPAQGRAHLKTGTLRDSSALAGYIQGASGRRYILVSLVNDANAPAARAFTQAVVNWLSGR